MHFILEDPKTGEITSRKKTEPGCIPPGTSFNRIEFTHADFDHLMAKIALDPEAAYEYLGQVVSRHVDHTRNETTDAG